MSKQMMQHKKGFKVKKETTVYVASESAGGWHCGSRPAPRPEVVEAVQKVWNTEKSLKRLRKFVDSISIQYTKTLKIVGLWENEKSKVTIYDDGKTSVRFYESVMVHEVVGHTFFHFALKYRREELVKFCTIANRLSPITNYIENNEEKWRKINDEGWSRFKALDRKFGLEENQTPEDCLTSQQLEDYCNQLNAITEEQKTDGHDQITRYANEVHSAIAELVYGIGHELIVESESLNEIIMAYQELHY